MIKWPLLAVSLIFIPSCYASLDSQSNAERIPTLLATCHVLNGQSIDWGDIGAVVQSTRLCQQRQKPPQQTEHPSSQMGYGTALADAGLWQEISVGRSLP